jgi:hypothetical protein
VYSVLNGDATEIADGAGRRMEISRKIETSVEEIFWPQTVDERNFFHERTRTKHCRSLLGIFPFVSRLRKVKFRVLLGCRSVSFKKLAYRRSGRNWTVLLAGNRQTVVSKLSRLRRSGLGSVSNLAHAWCALPAVQKAWSAVH